MWFYKEDHCPWHCGLIAVSVGLMNVNQVCLQWWELSTHERDRAREDKRVGWRGGLNSLFTPLAIKQNYKHAHSQSRAYSLTHMHTQKHQMWKNKSTKCCMSTSEHVFHPFTLYRLRSSLYLAVKLLALFSLPPFLYYVLCFRWVGFQQFFCRPL